MIVRSTFGRLSVSSMKATTSGTSAFTGAGVFGSPTCTSFAAAGYSAKVRPVAGGPDRGSDRAANGGPAGPRLRCQVARRVGRGAALGFGLLLAGLSGLTGCADPVIVDPIPDGGARPDQGDGGSNATQVWVAAPAATAAFPAEGPAVDARRRWKRDPHFLQDSAGTQYLFFSGSDYNKEAWTVSYFTQSSGTVSLASTWTPAIVGTVGTWYSGDITGPATRFTQTEKTLFFAANVDPTRPEPTRPDYVFEIGRATYDGVAYRPASTPALSVPAFTGSGASDTPTTPRPDAYGVMDPWILDDGGGQNVTMYYAGLDCATGTCKFQIFRTVSTDGGLSFPPGNVVLSGRGSNPDEAGGVAGPSVVVRNGQYILTYTAVKTPPSRSRVAIRNALVTGTIGVAVSTDGMTFTNASAGGQSAISRVGIYREQGCSSPSLYLDAAQNLHSYFAGYYNGINGESYNIATADWTLTKQ